jgi:1,2-diacylglycerol 3-alpha-glucosyltransferase
MLKVKVDFICTGLGRVQRGYESFARECFDALSTTKDLKIRLFKGSGTVNLNEFVLPSLARNSKIAMMLGKLTRRSGYHVEQMSFMLPYIQRILKKDPPDLLYTSDANLANFAARWRAKHDAKFKVLFSNGGPVHAPFPEYDHVQQVAQPYLDEAMRAGEPIARHSLVPYGISVPNDLQEGLSPNKIIIRRELNLPLSRPIVISVGYVSAQHKRMNHVVTEVARISTDLRPFLILLGHQDSSSVQIQELAMSLLGPNGFRIASCSYQDVWKYYHAADLFVLASLKEGFGRVLLEAMLTGLLCVAHDHPVMRYVLGNEGNFTDMTIDGELASHILKGLEARNDNDAKLRRFNYVSNRFGWDRLKDSYLEMFEKVMLSEIRKKSR